MSRLQSGEPLRFGVVGTGMMGIEHINNVIALDGTEVAALCDTWAPSLDATQERLRCAGLDPAPAFDDHRRLLDSGLCDAVVVATPNHLHTDIVLDVAEAGLPQLVEKPLATTLDDCRRIIGGMEALGRDAPTVWVGLEYRYMAPVAALICEARAGTVAALRGGGRQGGGLLEGRVMAARLPAIRPTARGRRPHFRVRHRRRRNAARAIGLPSPPGPAFDTPFPCRYDPRGEPEAEEPVCPRPLYTRPTF